MNIKEYKKILELLPLGFAFYDGNGDLIYSNKNAGRISPDIFPKKFKDLNISSKNFQKLNMGKTILVDNFPDFNLNVKPLKKMRDGCIILARETPDKNDYAYLATHDSMTGLYNRWFFETEFERFKNGRDFPVSLIFLDIDKLKAINDKYGHTVGDTVIIKTAEILKKSIRKNDIAARVGGDEFVILVPETDDKVASRIIGKIQKELETHNKKSKRLIKVSMGYGVAEDKKEMELVLKEADQNMYKQKKKNHCTHMIKKYV